MALHFDNPVVAGSSIIGGLILLGLGAKFLYTSIWKGGWNAMDQGIAPFQDKTLR